MNGFAAPIGGLAGGLLHGALFLAALTACSGESSPADVYPNSILAEVSAENFRTHMAVLADDAMWGRETGTEGYDMAAAYVAEQFARFGLTPAGDTQGYFQHVPFMTTRLEPDSSRLEIRRGDEVRHLVFGDEFVSSGGFGAIEDSVTAPLVFAGYGIRAPQHGHDDFAGIDCENRILVRLTGAPPGFPNDERAYYSSGRVKDGFAVEQGAVGVITVRAPVDLPRLTWDRYTAAIGSAGMRWVGTEGSPFEANAQLRGEAVLGETAAVELFALAGHDLQTLFASLDSTGAESFELDLEATMVRRSVQGRLSAPNVIGMIPGSDPQLQGEYLLYTAHLDHLGVRSGESGNEIYSGAYDNAAGVAALLEVARIIANNPQRIGRSVVFAALTGEEKGLQGSSYLAHHPPFPIADLVSVINIDMPYLGFPIAEIMGLGAEHSSLHAALERAAQLAGLEYVADPRPELVRFIRSDQFSFVQEGVPGLNLKPGTRSADLAWDGPAMHEAFLREHYHQPSDSLDLPFSAEGSRRFTAAALMLGLEVAGAKYRPSWNPGDFFGERFAGDP
ncbi:MAG: M28 family metallopeptidase [Xanthomonadales bacterium]|nr:M28 family metallopeptidase [Xanthomonadales bacterium]